MTDLEHQPIAKNHNRQPIIDVLCSKINDDWISPQVIEQLARQYGATPSETIVSITASAMKMFNLQGCTEDSESRRPQCLDEASFLADWIVECLQHFQTNGHSNVCEALVSCASLFQQHEYFTQLRDALSPELDHTPEDSIPTGLSVIMRALL